jgi:methyltransferase (TIGR00027 family)
VAEVLIENVSDTAFWVAHYRGLETARPDALFHDPLAAVLAGERGKRIAETMPRPFFTAWTVAVRTSLIDDYIRAAVADGVDTILNLGAGLDTRPYRMELPASLHWIEVDYPDVIAFKEQQLAHQEARCQLKRVKLDLAQAAERRQLLARINASAKKMLVLTEGVVPYLSLEDVACLADDLRALDHLSYWIVDYFSPEVAKHRNRLMRGRMRNAPFKFLPADWFAFFAAHGWRSKELRYLPDEAQRLKRPLPLPLLFRLTWMLRALFASKARRQAFRQFAGYALLEPIGAARATGQYHA